MRLKRVSKKVTTLGILASLSTRHPWPLEVHQAALNNYFRRRGKAREVPRVFEAAIILDLAERFRASGGLPSFRHLLSRAVETHPRLHGLADLEANLNDALPLSWQAVLLPRRASQTDGPSHLQDEGPPPSLAEAPSPPDTTAAYDPVSVREVQPAAPTPTARGAKAGLRAQFAASLRTLASRLDRGN